MSEQTVICDLDGTLCDIEHRLHFLEGKKDWDSFYDACDKDLPNRWCVDLLEMLYKSGIEIIFVSGRRESTRIKTVGWIIDNLDFLPAFHMYMRKDGDYRRDSIIKKEIYEKHLKDKDILFVIDDRKQVVDMWREQGLVCLQCAEGSF